MFTPEWVDMLAPSAESGMAAKIKLFWPGESVYDPVQNEYVPDGTEEVIYTGKARVQPFRMEIQRYQISNPTSVQNVRVQIPISEGIDLDIMNGMTMHVTSAELMPVLKNYVYTVSAVVDSSNPFERTFQCVVDQEVRRGG